jgi:hypothetical protein
MAVAVMQSSETTTSRYPSFVLESDEDERLEFPPPEESMGLRRTRITMAFLPA